MLYLTCTTITSVDLEHYGVSRAKDWYLRIVVQLAQDHQPSPGERIDIARFHFVDWAEMLDACHSM